MKSFDLKFLYFLKFMFVNMSLFMLPTEAKLVLIMIKVGVLAALGFFPKRKINV